MQSEDKIKDIFSSKLKDFRADVPADMWDKIAQNLSEDAVFPSTNKVSLFRRLAIVASTAAAVVGLCFMLFLSNNDKAAKQISENLPVEALRPSFVENNTIEKEDTRVENAPAKLEAKTRNKLLASAATYKKSPIANHKTSKNTATKVVEDNNANVLAKSEKVNTTTTEIVDKGLDKPVDKKELQDKIEAFINSGNNTENLFPKEVKPASNKKGVSLAFAGKSGLSTGTNNRTYVPNPFTKSSSSYINAMIADEGNKREAPVNMDHNQPVSFGLTASKNIGKRLSVETGIVYTYLSSKVKSEEKSKKKRSESQYFHYLGIPISLNYNFAEWGKAEFYVSGGVMAQKDFHGRFKGKQVLSEGNIEKAEETFNEKINQDRIQFSATATAGASYPIYDKLHIYTTVGGAYYFDANNKYKTIYSDRKFQPDLNIGLKLKL